MKTLKRDFAKLANFPKSQTVIAKLPILFNKYNPCHLHSTFDYLTAKLFWDKRAAN